MPAPFQSSTSSYYHNSADENSDDDQNDNENLPTVPVAELRGHDGTPIHIVRFTADGKYCVTGGNDRTVRLFNPTRIDPAYRLPPKTTVTAARPSPSSNSSQHRLQQSTQQPTQQNLPPAIPIQTYSEGHLHPVHALAVNSSSTVLLSSSDKTLLATDLVTAQTKQKWWGHYGRIEYAACLGGGQDRDDSGRGCTGEEIYGTASYDATVRLWDARSRSKEPLMILDEAKDAVTGVSLGGGEAQIVTSSVDGKIRTYDLRTAQLITEDLKHPITSLSICNDGTTIAASCLDGIIRCWGTDNTRIDVHKNVFQKFHSFHKSGNYKVECAFTSNEKYLISGSECGAVVVYPMQSTGSKKNDCTNHGKKSKATTLVRHTGPTCSVACCPRQSRPWLILSASYDGSAIVWTSKDKADQSLVE